MRRRLAINEEGIQLRKQEIVEEAINKKSELLDSPSREGFTDLSTGNPMAIGPEKPVDVSVSAKLPSRIFLLSGFYHLRRPIALLPQDENPVEVNVDLTGPVPEVLEEPIGCGSAWVHWREIILITGGIVLNCMLLFILYLKKYFFVIQRLRHYGVLDIMRALCGWYTLLQG